MKAETVQPPSSVAFVIPVYQEPLLLGEAVESIRTQSVADSHVLLVSSSGSSDASELAESYSATDPNRIHHLRALGGGYGAALNAGAAYALARMPDLDGVGFLDAEDWLAPGGLSSMQAELAGDEDAGWFVDGPGLSAFMDGLARQNAGGLAVKLRLLKAGLRFHPESDRPAAIQGFVSAAVAAGCLGSVFKGPVFVRRGRPDGLIRGGIQSASTGALTGGDPGLADRRSASALEHKHRPRFFLAYADTNRFFECTDPHSARELSFRESEKMFFASILRPEEAEFPPVTVVTAERKWKALAEAGLTRFVLWDLQRRMSKGCTATLMFMTYPLTSFSASRAPLDYCRPDRECSSLFFHHDVIAVPTAEIRRLIGNPPPSGRPIEAGMYLAEGADRAILRGPADLTGERAVLRVPSFLDAFCERLLQSRYRAAIQSGWLAKGLDQSTADEISQAAHTSRGGVRYPLVPATGVLDIGFVTPFFDFGGVERVTTAVAGVLRRRGFRTHLFVVGASPIHLVRNAVRAFDTLNWFPTEHSLATGEDHYGGTRLTSWTDPAEQAALLQLLAGMDVVINEHSGAAHAISGELKRRGTMLITHEHVVELSPSGRPHGPPFRALAYSANYDRVIACSNQLGEWLLSMGVPRSKLVVLPNGPGFRQDGTSLPERTFGFDHRPIRLMFIGRLDRQKGLDRLLPIVEGLERVGVRLEMKIVGKSVVEAVELPATLPANVRLHRPVYDDSELGQLYAWADFVLIPSRYEGLPLTISEAQAAGAIVLATDVGAVSEVIVSGETGFCFSEESYVGSVIATIADLARKPQEATRMSAQARSGAVDWDVICDPLIAAIEELAAKRSPTESLG